MGRDDALSQEEIELHAAIDAIMQSDGAKKLVIAGPGTGKTTLFKRILEASPGGEEQRLVLTFINNLRDDLAKDLEGLARALTLHSYCLGLLHRSGSLRGALSQDFRCCPGLAHLIAEDWELINGDRAPQFVGQMRSLAEQNQLDFYLARGDYYDAVDFDDSVYRTYVGLASGSAAVETYELVLIDEYQDFNAMEAGIIRLLGTTNPLVVAGDDDQALYSQFRDASWDYIRALSLEGEFEVFELPFCMRCPEVVVEAVNDVIKKARELHKLEGRIEKPYKHFPPVKGEDSAKYPKIREVRTSVQSKQCNYMGRYIAEAIAAIPADEVEAAVRGGYPAALVIVAKPYREQIIEHLVGTGLTVDTKSDSEGGIDRARGLLILKQDSASNLGWRVVLGADRPDFMADVVRRVVEAGEPLIEVIPREYRDGILAEATSVTAEPEETPEAEPSAVPIKVTSFEGAKGLSAQHVFIAGLHDGEIPHDPAAVQDIEICKFVVGLTRTRKRCTLVHTGHFATSWKQPSVFIAWIEDGRMERKAVDKNYWK